MKQRILVVMFSTLFVFTLLQSGFCSHSRSYECVDNLDPQKMLVFERAITFCVLCLFFTMMITGGITFLSSEIGKQVLPFLCFICVGPFLLLMLYGIISLVTGFTPVSYHPNPESFSYGYHPENGSFTFFSTVYMFASFLFSFSYTKALFKKYNTNRNFFWPNMLLLFGLGLTQLLFNAYSGFCNWGGWS